MSLSVSVVIPMYNHERYVVEAVRSALDQTHPPREVIVVDDGSTDGSATALDAFGDDVTLLSQRNTGVSGARNAGVAASSGDVLAFLDADDRWHPRKLERQTAALASSSVPFVHCAMREIDDAGEVLGVVEDGLDGWVEVELLLFRRSVIIGGGSGFLVTRKVFDTIGGFDERLSTSADWDFFRRVAAEHPIAFVDEPLLDYRLHATNMHRNIARMEHDMLLAFDKAFVGGRRSSLRRRAYGRLRYVLAMSYLDAGEVASGVRQLVAAGRAWPPVIAALPATTARTLVRAARRIRLRKRSRPPGE